MQRRTRSGAPEPEPRDLAARKRAILQFEKVVPLADAAGTEPVPLAPPGCPSSSMLGLHGGKQRGAKSWTPESSPVPSLRLPSQKCAAPAPVSPRWSFPLPPLAVVTEGFAITHFLRRFLKPGLALAPLPFAAVVLPRFPVSCRQIAKQRLSSGQSTWRRLALRSPREYRLPWAWHRLRIWPRQEQWDLL